MAGGPNAAADVVRVDAPRLSRYGNLDSPEFAPVDVGFELDKAAGDPVILRAWANELGFELVPREAAKAAADIAQAAVNVVQGASELLSKTYAADADGVRTPTEARDIDAVAADTEQRVIQLRNINRSAMGGNRS